MANGFFTSSMLISKYIQDHDLTLKNVRVLMDKLKVRISIAIGNQDDALDDLMDTLEMMKAMEIFFLAGLDTEIPDHLLQVEKVAEIPGISSFGVKTLPTSTGKAELHVQKHEAKTNHFDLRIVDPSTNKAHSWALRSLPQPGEKVLAIHQSDHDPEYARSFEGRIESGYGKGNVSKLVGEDVEVTNIEANKISFVRHIGRISERFTLVHTDGNNWLLVNHTPTRESRPEVPSYKTSYKSIDLKKLDFSNPDEIMAKKIDGGHSIFVLREGKPIEVFSYRPTKGGYGFADYTYKTDLYKQRAKINAILRGEIFGRKNGRVIPSSQTSGILNSNTWNSRDLQEQHGKLDNIVFNVVKYNNQSFESEPFHKKLTILQEITKQHPELHLPEFAETEEAKRIMIDRVKSGKDTDSSEGIIVYNKSSGDYYRAKIKNDYDVYIRDFFPGKGRLKDKGIGGFYYSHSPEGPVAGKVGTGFSDDLRKEMYANPESYVGALVKVESQEILPSGALRAPAFKDIRFEQFPEKQ